MTEQASSLATAGLEISADVIDLTPGGGFFAEDDYPDPPADGDSDQIDLDDGALS